MQLRKTAVKPFLTPRHTSYGYLHNFHTALTTPAAKPWLNPNDFLKKIRCGGKTTPNLKEV